MYHKGEDRPVSPLWVAASFLGWRMLCITWTIVVGVLVAVGPLIAFASLAYYLTGHVPALVRVATGIWFAGFALFRESSCDHGDPNNILLARAGTLFICCGLAFRAFGFETGLAITFTTCVAALIGALINALENRRSPTT